MSTSFLSLVKRSGSWKKDKEPKDKSRTGDGNGRSTPTSPLSPSTSLSSLPSNHPLLPGPLHGPPPVQDDARMSSRTSADPPRTLPLPGPSSEPQYGESSSSTLPTSPIKDKRPLLETVRSSFTRRQGKEVTQSSPGEDEPDWQSRRARSPNKTSRQPRPPSLDLSSSAFVLPSSRSPVPSQISLPPESPSEALHETEVVELQAFVDKKRWIEDRIEVLKSLPPIECFVVLMPTFRNGEELPATEQETATLPTQEELDEMWAEQDRIEEEADRFDGGDLTRLRKMAKAASQKSLSVSDTDLLSITLSTLYLLDTLLHLLRARAETLDLLALRLQWDAMRFAVGRETEAIEKDVRAFVEGKGQWGVEKYEKGGSVGGMGSPLLGASARDGGGQGRRDSSDSGSIRSVGGSSKVATKSQRYLLTQILELDSQAFHNRISSLRSGPVVQTGKILDRMIDVAASVRSHQTKRKRADAEATTTDSDPLATSTSSAESSAESAPEEGKASEGDDGAVPEWFLDEMDRVDDRVGKLQEMEDLARASVRQWKYADQMFHTTRKLLNESATLSSEVSQAFLQHPTSIRSKAFTAKASAIVAELTLVPDPSQPSSLSTFPRHTHASISTLPSANRAIATLLSEELASSKDEARRAHRLAKDYGKLVERVDQLGGLKTQMDELADELEDATAKLENGIDGTSGGRPIDLSTSDSLQLDKHAVYLAQLPLLSDTVASLGPAASTAIRETAALVLTIRSAGGVDPNFRASIEATSARLEAALKRAVEAEEESGSSADKLAKARSLDGAQKAATRKAVDLKATLIAQIEGARWMGIEASMSVPSAADQAQQIESLLGQAGALELSVAMTVVSPLDRLTASSGPDHARLVSHLSATSAQVERRLGTLRELARLLQAVSQQTSTMAAVAAEGKRHTTSVAEIERSITLAVAEAKQSPGSPDANPQEHQDSDQALKARLASHTADVRAFVASLSGRISFVASPSSSAALLPHQSIPNASHAVSLSPLTPPRSPAQPFFDADMPSVDPSSSIDLAALDTLVRSDGNLLAATLSASAERLEGLVQSIEVARVAAIVDRDADALRKAVDEWEADVARHHTASAVGPSEDASTSLTELEKRLVDAESKHAQAEQAFSAHAATTASTAAALAASYGAYLDTPAVALFGQPDVRGPAHRTLEDSHGQVQQSSADVLDRLASSIQDRRSAIDAEKERLAALAEEARLEEETRKQEAEEETLAAAKRVREQEEEQEAARLAAEKAERDQEEERLEGERQDAARLAEEAETARLAVEEATRLALQKRADEEEQNAWIATQTKHNFAVEAERVRALAVPQQAGVEPKRAPSLAEPLSSDASTPRTRTASSVLFPSSSTAGADDVFGPFAPSLPASTSQTSSSATPALDQISRLRDQVEALALGSAIGSMPSSSSVSRHLPTAADAARARDELESVKRAASTPSATQTADEQLALDGLHALLDESAPMMDEMDVLASFSSAILRCDDSFSILLDRIDEATSVSRPVTPTSPDKTHASLQQTLDSATNALDRAVIASKKVFHDDPRVASEIHRVTQALEEMKDMAAEKMDPLSHLSRIRSPSVASSYGGSMDGSVDEFGRQGSIRALSRSSSTASISSSRSTRSSLSRIPRSSSISHSLASVAASPTTTPGRSRIPTSTSRPRIPSMMFRPPALIKSNEGSSPRSFSGPASSTPTASTSSGSRQPHYFAPTASSRERTISTISSTSTSTQVPSTPVRARISSTLGRVTSPSPFQNPPSAPSHEVRSSSTVSRYQYKRPSTASESTRPFGGEPSHTADPRAPHRYGTMPTRRSGSIHSRLDEEAAQSTPTKRVSLGGGVGTSVAPRKRYRAKKDHKLDRAVGKIVNALPVEIPIAPVVSGLDSESGKYWIGHPPKLCFCRILRSKTVMVRVGGGWVELSKFLRDHFGIDLLANTATAPVPATPGSERWIRGGGGVGTPLHTSAGAYIVPPSTPGPTQHHLPPSTPNLTFPRNSQSPQLIYSTPSGHAHTRRARHSSLSPAIPSFTSPVLTQSQEAGSGSPGSPLVPLHIMRKAGVGEASPPAGLGMGMMRTGSERRSMGVAGGLRSSIGGGGAGEGMGMGRSFSGGSLRGEGKTGGAPWRA